MKTRALIAAIAAALALPALAVEAPTPPPTPKAPRAAPADPWSGKDFKFDIDMDMMLADASELAQRHGEMAIEYGHAMEEWAREFSADMHGSMAFMFGDRVSRGKLVKGQPYSAEVVTETKQTLGDGNTISHRNANRVYRDGEGRTRQETYRGDKLRAIYISDPVGQMSYTLMPGAKIAVAVPRTDRRSEPRAPRAEREKMSSDAARTEVERRVVVRRADSGDGPGSSEEVRVQVYRFNDGQGKEQEIVVPRAPKPPVPPVAPTPSVAPTPPMPPMPPMPGVQTLRFEGTGRGKGVTTSLGSKDFEGVKAEGKSTQWTIAAGEVGNKNPIVITSESWYSPDLQVTVYSRYSDPRTGESIYRLAGLKRAEPGGDLFKVPEDYKMRGKTKANTP